MLWLVFARWENLGAGGHWDISGTPRLQDGKSSYRRDSTGEPVRSSRRASLTVKKWEPTLPQFAKARFCSSLSTPRWPPATSTRCTSNARNAKCRSIVPDGCSMMGWESPNTNSRTSPRSWPPMCPCDLRTPHGSWWSTPPTKHAFSSQTEDRMDVWLQVESEAKDRLSVRLKFQDDGSGWPDEVLRGQSRHVELD